MGKFKIPKLKATKETEALVKLQQQKGGKEEKDGKKVKKKKKKFKSPTFVDQSKVPTSTSTKTSNTSSTTTKPKPKKKRKSSGFKPPSISKNMASTLSSSRATSYSTDVNEETGISDDPQTWLYFKCMWTKMSNKKNKTYQDGIFVVQRTRYSLLNDKGKEIAKTVCKTKLWKEGQVLSLGNKEIELFQNIKADDFLSGAVFMKQPIQKAPKKKKSKTKTFKKHKSTELKSTVIREVKYVEAPPDCLILNQGEKQPVWVDYHLSSVLRPHQRKGIQFMYDCCTGRGDYNGHGCILADEMGLGKTLQAITLMWTLLNRSQENPSKGLCSKAVIVTNSSLVGNWANEIKKWLGPTRCKPLICTAKTAKTDPEETIKDFKLGFQNVLLISYALCTRYGSFIAKCKPDLLICDEGHKLKNSTIKIYRALNLLKTPRRIILTGTPLQNNLEEFYCIIDFINPLVFDGDVDLFRNNFVKPINRAREPDAKPFEKNIGLKRSKQLTDITQKFILRRTQAILNKHLPPKIEAILFIKMSPVQRRLYRMLLKSKKVLSLLSNSDGNALSIIQNLKKLLTHPDMMIQGAQEADAEEDMKDEDEESDMNVIKKLLPKKYPIGKYQSEFSGKLFILHRFLLALQKTKEKVVLVSNFTSILDVMQEILDQEEMEYCRLDGSTPSSKRTDIVQRFNDPKSSVFAFLLSSKAGGTGLNLIGASRLVLFDLDWNPATDSQVMARIWREGQKRQSFIYRLIASATIEEKIYQRQMVKLGLSKMVADTRNNRAAFSKQFLRELFFYHESDDCQTFQRQFKNKGSQVELLEEKDPIFYEAISDEVDRISFVKMASENFEGEGAELALEQEDLRSGEYDNEDFEEREEPPSKRRKTKHES